MPDQSGAGRIALHYAVAQDLSADGRLPPSIDDFKHLWGTARPVAEKEIERDTHRSSANLRPNPLIAKPDRSIRVGLAFCQMEVALRELAREAGDAIA